MKKFVIDEEEIKKIDGALHKIRSAFPVGTRSRFDVHAKEIFDTLIGVLERDPEVNHCLHNETYFDLPLTGVIDKVLKRKTG